MPIEITMPQLSDTMSEGVVALWKKAENDKVKAGEEIADIETDKATMPLEAFEDGVLAKIVVPAGQKVKVGDVIAILAKAGEDVAKIRAASPTASAPVAAPVAAAPAAPAASASAPAPVAAPAPVPATDARIRISPLAKKVAEELGVSAAAVKPSGPGGRIVERDVRDFAASQPVARVGSPAAAGVTTVVELSRMRQTIASRLQQSKQTIPHFYEKLDVRMESVIALRTLLNSQLEKSGVKLTLNDFLVKAAASALRVNPQVNATFDGAKVTRHASVNVGVAVALPDGLIVPVLRDTDRMGLRDIRLKSQDLFDRAKAGKLRPDEFSGGTFTISNLGAYGIDEFTAIINPPEVAILAVGAAKAKPVVEGDSIRPGQVLTLTLSADHRVIDGAVAAQFLASLRGFLEQPGTMLL